MSNEFYPALQSVRYFYLPIIIIQLNSTSTVVTKSGKSAMYLLRKNNYRMICHMSYISAGRNRPSSILTTKSHFTASL